MVAAAGDVRLLPGDFACIGGSVSLAGCKGLGDADYSVGNSSRTRVFGDIVRRKCKTEGKKATTA